VPPRPPRNSEPSRRQILKSAAALAAIPAVTALPGASPRDDDDDPTAGPRRPNILYVLADSHRSISLGCYGDDQVMTPGFDAFAKQGARFTSAVANTPLCRPYRASLMSGTWGHRNGMLTNTSTRNFGVEGQRQWNPGELPLLGETFRDAGYRCGYVGKWHLGEANLAPGPMRFGFDDRWAVGVKPVHDYKRWTYFTGKDQSVSGEGGFRPAMEANLALDFIDAATADDAERPWLCMLSWGPPHDPFIPPAKYRHYSDITLPPNVPLDGDAESIAREELPLYYGLIEAIDHQFSRLMKQLDARGLADNTIVIYTSDHGNMMGAFDYLGKEMPYHESTGVPFLLRWPGKVEAASIYSTPFGAPDIFPTLVGLTGIDRPEGIDGTDLSAGILGQANAPGQDAAYLAAWDTPVTPWPGWRGVRTERYLYARRQDRPWMLFDLQEDPWQQHDLRKDNIPLRQQLNGLTLEWMERLSDVWGA
jgi:arylsulfatase A-like enzyme